MWQWLTSKAPSVCFWQATWLLYDSALLSPSIQFSFPHLAPFYPIRDSTQFLYSPMVFTAYRGESHIKKLPNLFSKYESCLYTWMHWVPSDLHSNEVIPISILLTRNGAKHLSICSPAGLSLLLVFVVVVCLFYKLLSPFLFFLTLFYVNWCEGIRSSGTGATEQL